MKYIIMSAGNGKRWNNYMGVPKQYVDINGEPLLHRTVRMLKERGIKDIYITDKEAPGSTTYKPTLTDYEIDMFAGCLELWEETGAMFLYGDVYYTEEAINKIVNNKSKTWHYFGRSEASETGKDHAEIFAIKIPEKYVSDFKEVVFKIRNQVEKGIHRRGLGWHTYMELTGRNHNIPVEELRHVLADEDLINFTEINDETDDFDYPEDYEQFIAKNKIIFYFNKIWLGGTFKATYALIQKLHKYYNIEVLYDSSDSDKELIRDLLSYVPVRKIRKEEHAKIIVNVTLSIPNPLLKGKIVQWVHSAIKELDIYIPIAPETIEYVSVSKFGKKQTDQKLNVDSKIIYNEIDENIKELAEEEIELEDAKIKLVSVTRLSDEKGWNQKLEMAKKLKDYRWYIIGTGKNQNITKRIKDMFKDYPNVIFAGARLNPYSYIKWSDYLVAPSERETWNLAVNEALILNTPVITSEQEAIGEQITHGKNGYIFKPGEFDPEVIENKPIFTHKQFANYKDWFDILGTPEKQKNKKPGTMIVRNTGRFKDLTINKQREVGETWEVDHIRGKGLIMVGAPIEVIQVYSKEE